MKALPSIFVGNVGLHSITVCGSKCKEYLRLPNSRFTRECVVVECETEEELIDLLQILVQESIPFEDTYKSQAAKGALYYRDKGLLVGEVVSFDWGLSGSVYQSK